MNVVLGIAVCWLLLSLLAAWFWAAFHWNDEDELSPRDDIR